MDDEDFPDDLRVFDDRFVNVEITVFAGGRSPRVTDLEHVVLDKAVLENAYNFKIVKVNVYKLLIDGDCERIGWCLLPNDGSWVEVTH